MPGFTPGRRWQPPYYPFQSQGMGARLLQAVERLVKGPLFGCRMCGNCLLQETAFICPMECPKGLRNGPCGGSTPERCYVDPNRICIWYEIYDRSARMGREAKLLEVLPPLDWDRVGTETWGDVVKQLRLAGAKKVFSGFLSKDAQLRAAAWDSVFRPVRQPDWWQGDSEYHPPASREPVSRLQQRLQAGEFVVTTEVAPPVSAATSKLLQKIRTVSPYVAAVNFTDCPSATPRMASWACSSLALQQGVEPVMQITSRDHTRVGLQADALGASAAGIHNLLCLSGDSMRLSPSPKGRMDIVDIDSIQMLWILRRMRDEGHYLDGREIKFPPKLFLGAAASPFASNPQFQAIREQKKVNAGAQFFQTNVVFDTDVLETWLNELARRDVLNQVYILVGITPMKSVRMAHYMAKEVPGVRVPQRLVERMEAAGSRVEEEGVQIALEVIEKVKTYQGIHGIHLMAVGWEEIVPRIVTEARLPQHALETASDGV